MTVYQLTRPADARPRFTYIDPHGNVRGSGKDATVATDASVRVFVPVHVDYSSMTVERRGANASSLPFVPPDRLG